mmetsp:Transcript_75450/g.157336  ORF Transcript_75450/g.157336 Transcript_75450/m.157336 type:complete len:924 (-) Transcript_75450:447-3218(-)
MASAAVNSTGSSISTFAEDALSSTVEDEVEAGLLCLGIFTVLAIVHSVLALSGSCSSRRSSFARWGQRLNRWLCRMAQSGSLLSPGPCQDEECEELTDRDRWLLLSMLLLSAADLCLALWRLLAEEVGLVSVHFGQLLVTFPILRFCCTSSKGEGFGCFGENPSCLSDPRSDAALRHSGLEAAAPLPDLAKLSKHRTKSGGGGDGSGGRRGCRARWCRQTSVGGIVLIWFGLLGTFTFVGSPALYASWSKLWPQITRPPLFSSLRWVVRIRSLASVVVASILLGTDIISSGAVGGTVIAINIVAMLLTLLPQEQLDTVPRTLRVSMDGDSVDTWQLCGEYMLEERLAKRMPDVRTDELVWVNQQSSQGSRYILRDHGIWVIAKGAVRHGREQLSVIARHPVHHRLWHPDEMRSNSSKPWEILASGPGTHGEGRGGREVFVENFELTIGRDEAPSSLPTLSEVVIPDRAGQPAGPRSICVKLRTPDAYAFLEGIYEKVEDMQGFVYRIPKKDCYLWADGSGYLHFGPAIGNQGLLRSSDPRQRADPGPETWSRPRPRPPPLDLAPQSSILRLSLRLPSRWQKWDSRTLSWQDDSGIFVTEEVKTDGWEDAGRETSAEEPPLPSQKWEAYVMRSDGMYHWVACSLAEVHMDGTADMDVRSAAGTIERLYNIPYGNYRKISQQAGSPLDEHDLPLHMQQLDQDRAQAAYPSWPARERNVDFLGYQQGQHQYTDGGLPLEQHPWSRRRDSSAGGLFRGLRSSIRRPSLFPALASTSQQSPQPQPQRRFSSTWQSGWPTWRRSSIVGHHGSSERQRSPHADGRGRRSERYFGSDFGARRGSTRMGPRPSVLGDPGLPTIFSMNGEGEDFKRGSVMSRLSVSDLPAIKCDPRPSAVIQGDLWKEEHRSKKHKKEKKHRKKHRSSSSWDD